MKHIAIFALLCLASDPALAAPGWLAYGDIRGHLEPCGCDPKTDLGGITRLQTLIARERMAHSNVSVFSLGNTVPVKIGAQDVRLPFLVEAEAAIAPMAVLYNELEMEHQAATLQAISDLLIKPNYILSNSRTGARHIAESRQDAQFVALGYVSPTSKERQAFDAKLAEHWRAIIAKAKPRPAVLLFAGSDDDLKKIRAAGLFEEIISSNSARPMNIELGAAERDDEGRLVRLSQVGKDTAVRMVPWGGQGVLRGGVMMNGEAKSITVFLQLQPEKPRDLFNSVIMTSWLTPEIGDDGALKDLYTRYQAATKQAFGAASNERAKELANSPYLGAAACQSCHPAAFKVWQGSQHAHAYATLEVKDKHEDPTCVSCHIVGAEAKGGFVSKALSPQLANVQCENCHGPRKDHAANPTVKTLTAMPFKCESCHNTQHSPSFVADVYWEKIKHGL